MTTKLFSLTMIFLVLLTQPLFVAAQNVSAQSDWAAVQNLSAGARLQIETKDGKRQKGTLDVVSATAVTLRGNGRNTSVSKDDVQKIYQLRGGSRVTTGLIGAAVGAGGGAGAAAALLGATGGSDDTTGILGKGILIGLGIGAAIGVAVGKNGRRTLVYESK